MPHEMQQAAVNCAKKALETYTNLETDQKLKVCQYIEVTCLDGFLAVWLFRRLFVWLFGWLFG
jgi:hypothetical protein